MAGQAELGAGDVPIEFRDGQKVVLQPSLQACQIICRLHGNTEITINKIAGGDLDTQVAVMLAGLGSPSGALAKTVPALVYADGLYTHAAEFIRFVAIVRNGGRPPELDQVDEGAQSDEAPPANEAASAG